MVNIFSCFSRILSKEAIKSYSEIWPASFEKFSFLEENFEQSGYQ